MWTLNGYEMQSLGGAGGERFTRFVDALIRAEANTGGLPPSEIDTQVRVNIRDRGIDTRTRSAVPRDLSGFLSGPTCWQYKAQSYADIKKNGTAAKPLKFLEKAISEPAAEKFVREGHAYRYCLLGDITPDQIDEWEKFLDGEARKVNPQAPSCRVVDAGKLIGWAQRFPAVVGLVRTLPDPLYNLDSWQAQARRVIPEYVPIDQWAGQEEVIKNHLTFGERDAEVCLPVLGEAGVGKTRLVLECMSELPGAEGLVVYTRDENVALKVADYLSRNGNAKAILVSDECSVRCQVRIQDTLGGCADRVRVICINNTGARSATGAPEIWLEEMSTESAYAVLEKNFGQVPADRRHGYVDLAGGFLRLAADMCRRDAELSAGNLAPALASVETYIQARVDDPADAKVLDALALLPKVGTKGELEPQLECLCNATSMTRQQVADAVERIKDAPGFITVAGRFIYVTPVIVARVAFARAWNRWVADDPAGFMSRLTPELAEGFLEQIKAVGDKEVQRSVADNFRHLMDGLKPQQLGQRESMHRVARIVETDPEQYLPVLRRVVESATSDALRQDDGLGARRTLVWLCERLGAFKDFYLDAEAILFRLAEHETETIGNNATGIWRQFQRIRMSGSEVPFPERFGVLRGRLERSDASTFELCVDGLEEIFSGRYSYMLGPFTVGSRMRPSSWLPTTVGEERACWRSAIEVLQSLFQSGDDEHRNRAAKVLTNYAHELLWQGFLSDLRQIVAGQADPFVRLEVLSIGEQFLRRMYDTTPPPNKEAFDKYLADVRAWLEELRPVDFAGRLRSLVSRSPWDEAVRAHGGDSSPDLKAIAEEAVADPQLLDDQFDWLLSEQARSASLFGNALGHADRDAVLVRSVLDATTRLGEGGLARGYVFGLARSRERLPAVLMSCFEKLESSHPRVAVDLYAVVGDAIDGLNRALSLADQRKISPATLASFRTGVGSRRLRPMEFYAILERMVAADNADNDDDTLSIAIRLLSDELRDKDVLGEKNTRDLAWRIVERTTSDSAGRCADDWFKVLERLASFDADRATRILAGVLGSRVHDSAKRLLVRLAPDHPQAVFGAFAAALMDTEKSLYLSVDDCTALVAAMPNDLVMNWVRSTGIEGARAIARHVPAPHVAEDGSPSVPRLTDEFLHEYGDDDQVFKRFLSGTHGTEVWSGSAEGRFRSQAEQARRFLNHQNERVRAWAQHEIQSREAMAKREKLENEEHFLP